MLLIGLIIIAVGAFCQSSSYVPINKISKWSWESYWLVQGVFAWLVFPLLGALLAVPQGHSLWELVAAYPGNSLLTVVFGMLWGVGGLTFGLSMRYLGVALGQSIALGTCAGLGAILGPVLTGHAADLTSSVIVGVVVTLVGIAIIGVAGAMKSSTLPEEEKKKAVKDFNFPKGIAVALLAGFMSACFNIGLSFGAPLHFEQSPEIFSSLPATLLVTIGGFVTNAVYCLYQNRKNRTFADYAKPSLWRSNILFCALAGLLWYSQFFGLSLGKGFLGGYPALITFSWCILMALNVTFSNVWGIILKEWKGVTSKTVLVLVVGLAVLIFSTFVPELIKSGEAEPMRENAEAAIVRRYVSPVKTIPLSGDVQNDTILLSEGKGQAVLGSKDCCCLKADATGGASLLLDFGKELQGGLRIVTGQYGSGKPIKVRIRLGESYSEACCDIDGRNGAGNDHAIRDFVTELPWLGCREFGRSGFRFARIDVMDKSETLLLREVSAYNEFLDVPLKGSFRCSDERLNSIWETAVYTVSQNMQDYVWDGIKRDRLVWIGDMHPEVMTICSAYGWIPSVERSLDLVRIETPIVPGGSNAWMNAISSYSIWWLLIQDDWYRYQGRSAYLESQREYVCALLGQLLGCIGEDGGECLNGGRFLDWPSNADSTAIACGLQSLMIMAMEAGERLCSILGEENLAHSCADARVLLVGAAPRYLETFRSEGKASTLPGRKQALALMSLAGIMPSDEAAQGILEGGSRGFSTFYGYYMLQALAKAGKYREAMDIISEYWGGMLDLGATAFWEDFDIEWMQDAGRIDEAPSKDRTDVHRTYGNYCYKGYRHSLCHGWASGPASFLSQYILGVTDVSDGGRNCSIEPHLGNLEWAEGSFPTPYALLNVSVRKAADGSLKIKKTVTPIRSL